MCSSSGERATCLPGQSCDLCWLIVFPAVKNSLLLGGQVQMQLVAMFVRRGSYEDGRQAFLEPELQVNTFAEGEGQGVVLDRNSTEDVMLRHGTFLKLWVIAMGKVSLMGSEQCSRGQLKGLSAKVPIFCVSRPTYATEK